MKGSPRIARVMGGGLVAAVLLAAALVSVPLASASTPNDIDPAAGINNIDHVVFIVQENRSFDHYFGTFPGADGLRVNRSGRGAVCVPDPNSAHCQRSYHDKNAFDQGGPHNQMASDLSIDGGKMDGAVVALRRIGTACHAKPNRAPCRKATPGPGGTPDVMGYHTAAEIPNYWAYAHQYTLQDRMFAPADSWTLPSHLYLVSAWAATCPDLSDAMSCRSDLAFPGANAADDGKVWTPEDGKPRPYLWGDITWLLHNHGVSWAYYVGPDSCIKPPCSKPSEASTNPIMNPLPGFKTVEATDGFKNIRPNTDYFKSAAQGTLPSVSWVVPDTWEQRTPTQLHRRRPGVGDEGRERGDEGPRRAVAAHGDLHHLGRLGRVLRPRETHQDRRERLRDKGSRDHDQPVVAPGSHRPSDAFLRCVSEVDRGSVPRGRADRSVDRWLAGPAPDRSRECLAARGSGTRIRLLAEADPTADPRSASDDT